MANHYRNKNSTTSDPHPLPDQLRKALEETGREKFSSATPELPTILSPKPSRGFQLQLDNMNKSTFSVESFNRSSGSPGAASTHSGSGRGSAKPLGEQFRASSTGGVSSAGGVPLNQSPPFINSRGNTPTVAFHFPQGSKTKSAQSDIQHAAFAQKAKEFHDRLQALLSKIRNSSGIAAALQAALINDVQSLGKDYNQQHTRLLDAFERTLQEKILTTGQLDKAQRELQTAVSARDHAYDEIDEYKKTIFELQLKAKQSAENLLAIQSHWQSVNETLTTRLREQDEQIAGKRALWLQSNPGSSARRDAMNAAIRDPFNSPTAKRSFDTGGQMGMGGLGSPPMRSPHFNSFDSFTQPRPSLSQQSSFNLQDAPRGVRRVANLHSGTLFGRAMPGPDPVLASWDFDPSKLYQTEPGSPKEEDVIIKSRPDLEHLSDDEIHFLFKSEFSKFFSLVEGWGAIYCSEPNLENDRKIARSNQYLWGFMMNCCYPGQAQSSHSHVMTLLQDPACRPWFCVRMICGYLMKEVLQVETFHKFSPKAESIGVEIKKGLLERGLNNEARQKLIDRQAMMVQEVLGHADYLGWRQQTLSGHTKRLRDMLGPLLNDSADRRTAGRDLGAIAVSCWDLAENLYTSHLTFQVYFPETASKFNASTMISKDSTVDAMQLQIKQVRLKLVISPVVCLRDDRGTTIKAKALHLSNVLIMG